MKCPVCDANADAGGTFCQHCGAKLPASQAVGETETRATPPESPTARQAQSQFGQPPGSSPGAASNTAGRRGVVDVPEETLWEGTFSYKAWIGLAVLCGVATIVLFIVSLAYFEGVMRTILLLAIVVMWILLAARVGSRRLGISYKLTNHMFYHRHGVLTRVTDRIELIEVHDVTYEQGLIGRVVDVGRIKIASSDRTDPILYLLGVEEVERVAKLIDTARRDEQVRRGRRIEFSHADGGL